MRIFGLKGNKLVLAKLAADGEKNLSRFKRPILSITLAGGLVGFVLGGPLLPAALFRAGHTQWESAAALIAVTVCGALVGFLVGMIWWLATPPSR